MSSPVINAFLRGAGQGETEAWRFQVRGRVKMVRGSFRTDNAAPAKTRLFVDLLAERLKHERL